MVGKPIRSDGLPAMSTVLGDGSPPEPSAVSPGVEKDALFKGLALGGEDQSVMFEESSPAGFSEVELEGAGAKWGEGVDEVVAPMIAQAAGAEAGVNQGVIGPGRPDRTVVFGRVGSGGEGGLGEGAGFSGNNRRGEGL